MPGSPAITFLRPQALLRVHAALFGAQFSCERCLGTPTKTRLTRDLSGRADAPEISPQVVLPTRARELFAPQIHPQSGPRTLLPQLSIHPNRLHPVGAEIQMCAMIWHPALAWLCTCGCLLQEPQQIAAVQTHRGAVCQIKSVDIFLWLFFFS